MMIPGDDPHDPISRVPTMHLSRGEELQAEDEPAPGRPWLFRWCLVVVGVIVVVIWLA